MLLLGKVVLASTFPMLAIYRVPSFGLNPIPTGLKLASGELSDTKSV
jgi:hypothetical protein